MSLKRRPIANHPFMAKWIYKTALPMRSPRHLVIADLIQATIGSGFDGASDESVRIIAENLNTCGSGA